MEEKAAIAQLRQFCQNGAGDMSNNEIFRQLKVPAVCPPACNGRVIASPVSASPVGGTAAALDGGAGSVWLNELIWREFYAI